MTSGSRDDAGLADRTHAQRRDIALEFFGVFLGGEHDPARAALAMQRRHGALGTFAIDMVVGDVWSRPELSRRDRSLIVVSVLGALGSTEELSFHSEVALNHGVTRVEIDEAMLHVAAYAGFPRALQALRVIDDRLRRIDGVDRLPERPAGRFSSDAERRAAAAEVATSLRGQDRGDGGTDRGEPLGPVEDVAARWSLGDVWARDELSRRDRSLVTIAILASLGSAEDLEFHMQGGYNHGLTKTEMVEIMVHLIVYAGIARANDGKRILDAIPDAAH